MTAAAEYIDKLSFMAWLITAIFLIAGYRYWKRVIVSLLLMLYEFFIGTKKHVTPD